MINIYIVNKPARPYGYETGVYYAYARDVAKNIYQLTYEGDDDSDDIGALVDILDCFTGKHVDPAKYNVKR